MSTIDGLLAKMLHSTPQQFGWLCLTSSPPPYREMRRGGFFESSRTYHALARLGLALPLLAVVGLSVAVTRAYIAPAVAPVFGKQAPAEQTPEPPTEAPGQQDTSAPAEHEPRPVSGVVS